MRNLILCSILSASLTGCGPFSKLQDDIRILEEQTYQLNATVTAPNCKHCNIIAVVYPEDTTSQISHYRLLSSGEAYSIRARNHESVVFHFNDVNEDFSYTKGEPYAWSVLSDDQKKSGVTLNITLLSSQPTPPVEVENILEGAARNSEFPLVRGNITTLNDPQFNYQTASLGMWQPVEFVRKGHAGIFQLSPYDNKKQLILFVHGIGGHPGQFSSLIERLDLATQQAWVFYYPSGLGLDNLAKGFQQLVRELGIRHGIEEVNIVAHSMGGLISYRLIQMCESYGGCPGITRLITIATPFGGHKAAQSGVDYSPVVMPVWRDMAPSSDFLSQLGKQPLASTDHHLIFAYLPGESSDGVIEIDSQLSSLPQWQATSLRGYNAQHLGILRNEDTTEYVLSILSGNITPSPRQP